MTGSSVSIVIPCHNERDSVLRCLASIDRPAVRCNLIVVDDGSTDGTAEAVADRFPHAVVVRGDGSWWWSGAINAGLMKARERPTSHYLLLNNDCILEPSTVDRLVAATGPDTIVSPAILDAADGNPVSFGGRIDPSEGLTYHTTRQPIGEDRLSTVDWLPGHCVLIPAHVLESTGLMDATWFPHYWGDADFTLRARRQGARLAVQPDIQVLNDRGQTGIKVADQRDLRSLLGVLTSRRSWLRIDDNARFWWRHRDLVPAHAMLRRYSSTSVLIGRVIADRLRIRRPVRWIVQWTRSARRPGAGRS